MSDRIPTRDRIMALLSPPSQDVHLTVDDARWIKGEIERLQAVVDAAALYVDSLENGKNAEAMNLRLQSLAQALAALEGDDE